MTVVVARCLFRILPAARTGKSPDFHDLGLDTSAGMAATNGVKHEDEPYHYNRDEEQSEQTTDALDHSRLRLFGKVRHQSQASGTAQTPKRRVPSAS